MENLFNIADTAARLGCHPETVRRLIRQRDLTAVKVGRTWRIRESDLIAYLAKHTVEAKDVTAL